MKALQQLGSGFFIGLFFLLLVIGGVSLSLTESAEPASPPTSSPMPTTFAVEFATPFPSSTLPPAIIPTDTMIPPSATLFVPPTQPAVTCSIPNNWIPVTVGANDTLYTLAERYNTTVEELNDKNCLNLKNPAQGAVIYVPAVPTKVVVPCGPPATWVKRHVVQPGENLFRIALSYGITYPQLQSGNCMGSSTTIFVGQVLWVPNVPARTPTFIPATATTTNTATRTPDFSTPTNTATRTPDFSTTTNTVTPTPDFSTPTQTPTPPTPSP